MPGGVGGVASRDVPLSRLTRARPWTTPNNHTLSGFSGATTSIVAAELPTARRLAPQFTQFAKLVMQFIYQCAQVTQGHSDTLPSPQLAID